MTALEGDSPVLFTGEMIYPWMFEQDPALRPLRDAAEILAGYTEWPFLYEPGQLAANEIPVAAAIYQEDMYVDRVHSEQTARAIRGNRCLGQRSVRPPGSPAIRRAGHEKADGNAPARHDVLRPEHPPRAARP